MRHARHYAYAAVGMTSSVTGGNDDDDGWTYRYVDVESMGVAYSGEHIVFVYLNASRRSTGYDSLIV